MFKRATILIVAWIVGREEGVCHDIESGRVDVERRPCETKAKQHRVWLLLFVHHVPVQVYINNLIFTAFC